LVTEQRGGINEPMTCRALTTKPMGGRKRLTHCFKHYCVSSGATVLLMQHQWVVVHRGFCFD